MGAIAIDKGHYGDVQLDGLKIGFVFRWPGPIHEGKGKCQPIVDVKASAQQREALLKIMTGQDTEPFATMFAVFATTLEKAFDMSAMDMTTLSLFPHLQQLCSRRTALVIPCHRKVTAAPARLQGRRCRRSVRAGSSLRQSTP